jgi:hypothetical protein
MWHAGQSRTREWWRGLLLYPLVDDPLDVDLMVKGQRLRVRTIDLAIGWPAIRAQMLTLLSDFAVIPRV